MYLKSLFILATTIYITLCDNILVILDNTLLQKTHSTFLNTLKSKNTLQIAYSFGRSKIELKKYDRFKYDHVIVMCLSEKCNNENIKESVNQIKINDIVNYFDEGGNVIIVGDLDTQRSNRRLFQAFGVELDEYGSKLKDYINNHQQPSILTTTAYVSTPFLSTTKPLLYQGTGITLANYVNYQLYQLVASQSTAFSRNYIKQETTKVGRTTLVAGVQGLNNARALLVGSLYFFSDQAMNNHEFDNKQAVADLLRWTFHQIGILRASEMSYHGQGVNEKETLFNVGEKIYFSIDIEQQLHQKWQPYITEDFQVEFVMLDPWVRIPLVNVNESAKYTAQFYAPLKEGIYQFKVSYRKPGWTFLVESERVTVRPYKHDEYERFLLVAYPYQFGLCGTIASTFIFMVVYLYTSTTDVKKMKED